MLASPDSFIKREKDQNVLKAQIGGLLIEPLDQQTAAESRIKGFGVKRIKDRSP